MKYIIKRSWSRLKSNEWISILMAIEIMLGVSVLVYAINMYTSITKEERKRAEQVYDLSLEIASFDDRISDNEAAITLGDYKKVQEMTKGKTFCYIALPEFQVVNDKNFEYTVILADYAKLNLKKGFYYWGTDNIDIKNAISYPGMSPKKMPERLNKQSWKSEDDEIELKSCIIVPVEYLKQMEEEIESAYIHIKWNSDELENKEATLKNVEKYLNKTHGDYYSYRVYSPETELKNDGYKVKQSIRTIMQVGILFLAAFFAGMLSIFQLLFDRRKKSYGISLACGADNRTIFCEMFFEVGILNGIGTVIGIIIGYIITYYLDIGIMIGSVKIEGSIVALIVSLLMWLLITGIVAGANYRKMKQKHGIELLNEE